jgi:hypothetical protein
MPNPAFPHGSEPHLRYTRRSSRMAGLHNGAVKIRPIAGLAEIGRVYGIRHWRGRATSRSRTHSASRSRRDYLAKMLSVWPDITVDVFRPVTALQLDAVHD